MIHNIVVPTDFSSCAEAAAEYACALAVELRAKVTLLHVFTTPIVATPDAVYAPTEEETRAIGQAAELEVNALAGRLARPGLAIETRVVEGAPVDRILEAAKDAQLVVMGTHGRGAVGRLLLGSVAERVVRGARCPVMTLREHATQPSLEHAPA